MYVINEVVLNETSILCSKYKIKIYIIIIPYLLFNLLLDERLEHSTKRKLQYLD